MAELGTACKLQSRVTNERHKTYKMITGKNDWRILICSSWQDLSVQKNQQLTGKIAGQTLLLRLI